MSRTGRLSGALDNLAAVAMIAASSAIVWFIVYRADTQKAQSVGEPSAFMNMATADPIDAPNGPSTAGAQTARIALLEFSDFQCPFCARHATQTLKSIQKEFVDTGKIRYVFVHYPLEGIHPFAARAAQAAECAGEQEKFWEMHDRLFANQAMLHDDDLLKYAAAVNLDKEKFKTCMSGLDGVQKVHGDAALAARLQVASTPTFVLGEIRDGKIHPLQMITGALPYEAFRQAIEDALNQKVKHALSKENYRASVRS